MTRLPRAYDPAAGDVAPCQHCGHAIQFGQPYMTRIPFVGSFGGFVHRHCPPHLVASTQERTR